MTYKTKFKMEDGLNNPFNGEYIDSLTRIPNVGEHICFDGINQYEVIDIITKLSGWECFYIIVLKYAEPKTLILESD